MSTAGIPALQGGVEGGVGIPGAYWSATSEYQLERNGGKHEASSSGLHMHAHTYGFINTTHTRSTERKRCDGRL